MAGRIRCRLRTLIALTESFECSCLWQVNARHQWCTRHAFRQQRRDHSTSCTDGACPTVCAGHKSALCGGQRHNEFLPVQCQRPNDANRQRDKTHDVLTIPATRGGKHSLEQPRCSNLCSVVSTRTSLTGRQRSGRMRMCRLNPMAGPQKSGLYSRLQYCSPRNRVDEAPPLACGFTDRGRARAARCDVRWHHMSLLSITSLLLQLVVRQLLIH